VRALNRLLDEVFPTRRVRAKPIRQLHKEGEAARPEPDGPTGADVAARLAPQNPEPATPPPLGEEAARPDMTPPPEGAAAAPLPTSPLRPRRGPTAEQVASQPLPDVPRDRTRNVNLDYVQNVDEVGQALEATARTLDYGTEPGRSFAEVREKVDGNQMKIFEDVLTQDPVALSDQQLLAGREVLLSLSRRQEELAKKIARNQGSQEEILEFDKVSDQAAMVQDYMQGKIREAARALNSMKIVAQTINTADPRRIAEAAQGGNVVLRAQTVLDMKEAGKKPGEVIETLGKMGRIKQSMASIANLRNAGLVSGIRTNMLNAFNNGFHSAYRTLVVKPTAAGVGKLRTRGEAGVDRVYLSEASAEIIGTIHAIREALDIAMSAYKHATVTNKGEYVSMFGGRKIDEIAEGAGHVGSSTARLFGMQPGPVAGAADMYHRGVEAVSFNLLSAVDDFSKATVYNKTRYALAAREASRRGLEGDEWTKAVEEIINDPNHAHHQAAMRESEITTFTNREDVAGMLAHFADMVVKAGNMVPLVRWFFPFTRTPTAIFDRGIKNSPLALAQKQFYDDWQAGGATRDMAVAQLTVGTSLVSITGLLVAAGLMTGNGPSRKEDPTGGMRRTLEAEGWQANSLRIGDKLVSLKRGFDPVMLGPLAVAQSLDAARYAKSEQDVFDYTVGPIVAAASYTLDLPYLQGLKEILDLLTGRVNYADYTGRQAGSVIPNLMKDVDQMFRPASEGRGYVPKSDNMMTALALHLQNAAPGIDPPMQARYWDGTLATPGGGELMYRWNALTPIRASYLYNSKGRADDKATAALVDAAVPVSQPDNMVSIDDAGTTVDLLELGQGAELYEEYLIAVGNARRQAVESVVLTAEYAQRAEEGRAGPRSEVAIALSEALRAGATEGKRRFLAKVQEMDVDESTKELLRGETTRRLLIDSQLGSETAREQLRDLEVRGVPTRENLNTLRGSGSDREKRYDDFAEKTMYVPKIR
jgi:hypothetical protein